MNSRLTYYNDVARAAEFVEDRIGRADVGVVLGSGLGAFTEELTNAKRLKYNEIPGFPMTTVAGHAGELIAGDINGKRILCFAGRVHAYEGHDMQKINLLCRLARHLGCRVFILTNSSGGCLEGMTPGSIMVIKDHIRLTNLDPLLDSCNDSRFGPRYHQHSYSDNIPLAADLDVHYGAYCWSPGPTYETHAEVRAGIKLGAGAFGMSTLPEALAASAAGMELFAMALCTNMAAGIIDEELLHADVTKVAKEAGPRFVRVLLTILADLDLAALPPTPALETCPDMSLPLTVQSPLTLAPFPELIHSSRMADSISSIVSNLSTAIFTYGKDSISSEMSGLKSLSLVHDLAEFSNVASSASGLTGVIHFGMLNGKSIAVVHSEFTEGFTDSESYFLMSALRICGVRTLLTMFGAINHSGIEQVLSLSDYVDRSRAVLPAIRSSQLCSTGSLVSLGGSVGTCMQFAGPSLPSPAEVAYAKAAGSTVSCITSMSPVECAIAMGCNVVALAISSAQLNPLNEGNGKAFDQGRSMLIDALSTNVVLDSQALTITAPDAGFTVRRPAAQEDLIESEKAGQFIKNLTKGTVVGVLASKDFASRIITDPGFTVDSTTPCKDVPFWSKYSESDALTDKWSLIVGHMLSSPENSVVLFQLDIEESSPECFALHNSTFAVRAMKFVSISKLYVMFSAKSTGAIPENSLCVLTDHVNLSGVNPLFGLNEDKWGARFPDMSRPYDRSLRERVVEVADSASISCLETVAAYSPKLFVGDATKSFASYLECGVLCSGGIPEVIVARHMAIPTCAVCSVGSVAPFNILDILA